MTDIKSKLQDEIELAKNELQFLRKLLNSVYISSSEKIEQTETSIESVERDDDNLPEEWKMVIDKATNKPYYVNR